MLGNEAWGLAPEVLAACDAAVSIPIQRAESLNLAMAATVSAHGRIAEAIRAGNPDEARLAMKAVISEGFARAGGRLETRKAAPKR